MAEYPRCGPFPCLPTTRRGRVVTQEEVARMVEEAERVSGLRHRRVVWNDIPRLGLRPDFHRRHLRSRLLSPSHLGKYNQ